MLLNLLGSPLFSNVASYVVDWKGQNNTQVSYQLGDHYVYQTSSSELRPGK